MWVQRQVRLAARPRGFHLVTDEVLEAIRVRGPLGSRDLAGTTRVSSYRARKDTGLALYNLWLTGELMTHHRDGFQRIVFCRFIQTAHYLAKHLRDQRGRVEVEVVTGELAPEYRAARVGALDERQAARWVLVATDCLSEWVNLREGVQAVKYG